MPKELFKVLILGTYSVGKTSIVLRLKYGELPECGTTTTMNLSHYTTDFIADDGTCVELCYWDTAGQERYESVVSIYFHNANAVVVVFDANDMQTFEKAKSYIELFRDKCGYHCNALITVVANKIDLLSESDADSALEGVNEWCESKGYSFLKTSAVTGAGIQTLHTFIGKKMVDSLKGKTTPTKERRGFEPVYEEVEDKKCC